MIKFGSSALIAALLLIPTAALADDWVAIRLRGTVQQFVDGDWKPLILGAVVPDDRPIRTGTDGRVDFRRAEDQITLGGDTQIQIRDEPGGQRFTTIIEDKGSVESDVDVQNVQHFSVETPYLAAVVKGTHFLVDATDHGSSVVVTRGIVAVQSKITREQTTVTVGQTASIEVGAQLSVSGSGKLPPILIADDSAPVAAPNGPAITADASPNLGLQGGATGLPADGKVKLIASPPKDTGAWPFNLKSNEYGPLVVLGGVVIGLIVGGFLLIFRRFFG